MEEEGGGGGGGGGGGMKEAQRTEGRKEGRKRGGCHEGGTEEGREEGGTEHGRDEGGTKQGREEGGMEEGTEDGREDEEQIHYNFSCYNSCRWLSGQPAVQQVPRGLPSLGGSQFYAPGGGESTGRFRHASVPSAKILVEVKCGWLQDQGLSTL